MPMVAGRLFTINNRNKIENIENYNKHVNNNINSFIIIIIIFFLQYF